ncbi:MAG TPA: bacillithiol biosynthesis cysteine-adding enzyme BshC [Longimicrobium sp.]|nr:bacillithiol biosynthesis cysteine-adding enzyme BshC [Longimicrobium sp.]
MTLRIDVGPLSGSRLLEDYLAGSPRAGAFFSHSPYDLRAFREKLAEVGGRFGRAERETAAAAVHLTSPRAAERLARFVEQGGAMVTTGQQAGLFTGPMYTIHKILTAVRLAEALERELGVIVLPVFWTASEDHDFEEASHTYAVDGVGRLQHFAVTPTDPRRVPMSEMRLGAEVDDVLTRFRECVALEGDASSDLTAVLAAYRPGNTVAGAFRETIARLFDGWDLLLTDAADPALKRASAPVLLRELENAAEHERLVRRRTEELEAAGYSGQVKVLSGATNVFYHGPAGRERLARAGDGLLAREARQRFTREEIGARLRDEPASLSPNVFLRPVVESSVFPTLAYVGGPAEVAYFAQVAPLFEAYGIQPPIAYPRFSATLVPAEVEAKAAELGLDEEELRRPEHELASLLAERRLPAEVRARAEELRAALVDGFGRLMEAAGEIDANLHGTIGARRNHALLQAAAAERKVLAHWKKRDPAIARDLPRVRNHLAPLGEPQERVLNLLPFLARQPTLLHDLAARMEVRFAGGEPPPGEAEAPEAGAVHAPAATPIS